ncbi:MAG: amidase [Solirubrobacteraceae bacterium]|jgi:amidase|nr:amidase [Solirubrobacteraceae bacterium]
MPATATSERRELAFAGVARQAELVRSGEVSPRELVETALERIGRLDPELNAFRAVFDERALLEADQAGGRARGGDDRPLLGVPIAVKDDMAVAGTPRVRGSHAHGGPEPEDCELVRLLRAAGAIVIGVTRVPELMLWPFTETAQGGSTRNPWSLARSPGGSSGGSAAAVAAALVAGATGSDGAGSIRIPAACCGLFGLKVQRGRVPVAPLAEVWTGLSVYGFLTRSVADSALLYEVATGEPWVAAARREPGPLRIALSTKIPPGAAARLHPEQRRAALETADLLRALGHEVVERSPSYGLVGRNVIARYFAGANIEAESMADRKLLERRTRQVARIGGVARRLLGRALAAQDADARRINRMFDDVDVVLMPTLTAPPLRIGRWEGCGALRTFNGAAGFVAYNPLWNHIGNPAAAVPAGFDADGLPLSVQIAGPPDGEPTLLALAHQLETARPWAGARPPIS